MRHPAEKIDASRLLDSARGRVVSRSLVRLGLAFSMQNQSMRSAEKAETIRRVGIYVGPVILASVAGDALYGAAFGTTAINVGGMPPFMNAMFAAGGGAIAWRMTDTLGRIAWSVFFLHHSIQLLTGLWASRMGSIWSLGLTTLFAALATGSGGRSAPRRTLFVAGSVFVIATIAVFCARYYADELLGNHSVIR